MAVTVSVVDREFTNRKIVVADLTFSGSYTTGGEAPTNGFKKDLGLPTKVTHASIDQGGGSADSGVLAKYDYVNDKILLYRVDQIDDFAEQLPNATPLTNVGPLRVRFTGF